jgi:hypothetical protein
MSAALEPVRSAVPAATGIKMGLNFVVPFIVSNLGVLAATRRAQPARYSRSSR